MDADPDRPPDLQIVVPIFNEETSIEAVLDEWRLCLDACAIRYSILAIDDGSTDGTPRVLENFRQKWGDRLQIVRQPNAGHGASILRGYQRALESGVPWIFQIDSDGQCDPRYFPQVWSQRENHDIVAGNRTRRDDGLSRALVSLVLRLFLLLLFHTNCRDANVPYRLLRATAVAPLLQQIPPGCYFTNIALSILAKREHLRQKFIPITFRDRHGGTSTVNYGQLARHAAQLYRNLKALPKS